MDRGEIDARIKMADDMIVSLSEDLASFCKEHQSRIVFEKKGETTIPRMPSEAVPVEWRIRVGEIANLLRSSLDHLVWQLVLDNRNEPNHRNEFPIFNVAYNEKPSVERLLKGVADGHKRKILALNRNLASALPESLWNLKTICNVDKHRHANKVIVCLTGLTPEYRRKAELCDEEGCNLPAIVKEDCNVEVWFVKDEAKSPKKEWGPYGEVVGELEKCSTAVKAIINHVLNNAPL